MITPPEIVETSAQIAAVIHLTIPRDQIRSAMPAAIHELMAAVSGQGLTPAGPLFAHHLTTSSTMFDFEAGIPVSVAVAAVGRVKPGELPAATVIRSIYQGAYEGLFAAWAAFGKLAEAELGQQMKERGWKPGPTLWERYLAGPESSPDPGTWRTELNRPIIKSSE